jgi:hypothetical protein
VPQLGAGARSFLDTGDMPADAVLATLIDELHGIASRLVLVLDHFHVVSRPELHEGVGYLLEHLSERTRLVITSRADPPLPLARMRARGQLLEIRAADLRFTATKLRTTRTARWASGWRRTTSRRWTCAPEGGSPHCNSPPSRCRAEKTSVNSSPGSQGTIGSSSTTSSARSWNGSRTRSSGSSSVPRCWTDCRAPCGTP